MVSSPIFSMDYLAQPEHFSLNTCKVLPFDLTLNFEFEWDLNQSEFSTVTVVTSHH